MGKLDFNEKTIDEIYKYFKDTLEKYLSYSTLFLLSEIRLFKESYKDLFSIN